MIPKRPNSKRGRHKKLLYISITEIILLRPRKSDTNLPFFSDGYIFQLVSDCFCLLF